MHAEQTTHGWEKGEEGLSLGGCGFDVYGVRSGYWLLISVELWSRMMQGGFNDARKVSTREETHETRLLIVEIVAL